MREIITVQVGGFANFIGSHFWNFQDELLGLAGEPDADPLFRNHCFDMDVLYRTGENQNGILTYTPRLVSIDIQGSLGSMSTNGMLYNPAPEVPSHVATWRGTVSTHRSKPHEKNLFLQSLDPEQHLQMDDVDKGHIASQNAIPDEEIVQSLESSVQIWSDFSKVHFHPQSLYELSGLWMDAQDFDNYGIGKDAFSEGSRGEEMSDRLRFFVEECDHIQGIQFVVDDAGGFSSVAADFMEYIADEYAGTPVLLYAVRGPGSFMNSRSQKRSISRSLHDAVSFSRLSSLCRLFVPVGLPSLGTSKASTYLSIDDQKSYHCSAVYAAALHSLSLPSRMQLFGPTANINFCSGGMDMNGLVQTLAGQSRQNTIAILDAAMPAPLLTGNLYEQPMLQNLQPLTPETMDEVEDTQSVEALTIHGCLGSGGHRASLSEVQYAVSAAYGKEAVRPRFCHLSVALCPLPIPLPFPKIFKNVVGKSGELSGIPALNLPPKGPLDVDSIPMAARLRSSRAILPFLSSRLDNLLRFGIQRGAPGAELLRSWGFEKDELEDMGETLSKMIKGLMNPSSYSSSSDESD